MSRGLVERLCLSAGLLTSACLVQVEMMIVSFVPLCVGFKLPNAQGLHQHKHTLRYPVRPAKN
ncbi:hypothetical protein [Spirosoma daeguense]